MSGLSKGWGEISSLCRCCLEDSNTLKILYNYIIFHKIIRPPTELSHAIFLCMDSGKIDVIQMSTALTSSFPFSFFIYKEEERRSLK
jgi:hypothetical protein